jgi:excisionase family DNA binding protein
VSRRSYLLKASEPMVMVPARVAALLEARTNISGVRVQLRGLDPEATAVLEDIRLAALEWRGSATGTDVAPEPELPRESKQWMSTGQVASHLGVTDRAVRKAIARSALKATEVNGRYRITLEDMEHYRAARAA